MSLQITDDVKRELIAWAKNTILREDVELVAHLRAAGHCYDPVTGQTISARPFEQALAEVYALRDADL